MNNSKNSTSKESKDLDLKLLLKSIGTLLVILRKSLGYTNARLFAELNNIDPGQLGKYERGQSNMQVGSVLKVFKLYGVTEADIFDTRILNNPVEQDLLSATVKESR